MESTAISQVSKKVQTSRATDLACCNLRLSTFISLELNQAFQLKTFTIR